MQVPDDAAHFGEGLVEVGDIAKDDAFDELAGALGGSADLRGRVRASQELTDFAADGFELAVHAGQGGQVVHIN